jgi:acid phosphatase
MDGKKPFGGPREFPPLFSAYASARLAPNKERIMCCNKFLLITLLAAALQSTGCFRHKHPHPNEGLNSLLWCRTSVEYEVACIQTFRAAQDAVLKGLEDPAWSAAPEQTADFRMLPPAVIADVDETLLDNTPYQARLVKGNKKFNYALWNNWVNEERADAMPGAREFIAFLKGRGVRIFYVTNRSLEEPTLRNIQKVLDPDATADDVLCKNEQKGWGSDKTSRRAVAAKTHRILALLGDDYNDFAFLGKVSAQERLQTAQAHRDFWGTKWFVLPNPMYGHWEQSLYQYDYDMDHSDMLKYKYKHMTPEGL